MKQARPLSGVLFGSILSGASLIGATWIGSVALSGCDGGGDSSGGTGTIDLVQVSNGFGQLLPHKVFRLDENGAPTTSLVSIRSLDEMIANVRSTNPIQPPTQFPTLASLPGNLPGNHFLVAEFTTDVDVSSILDGAPSAQVVNALRGPIQLVQIDPNTGGSSIVEARVFVGIADGDLLYAATYAGSPGENGDLPLQRWVQFDPATGVMTALDVDGAKPGLGFPGTQGAFPGSTQIISPRSVVFVADSDASLATHETFPSGVQLRMSISTGVKSTRGATLSRRALAAATVGTDSLRPEVAVTPPPDQQPEVSPGGGDQDIDPLTTIQLAFTEPIQPLSIGSLPDGTPPVDSSAVFIEFGPAAARVRVPFQVQPLSVFDLTTYELIPAFNFPGEGPPDLECGVYNRVDVTVNPNQVWDLAPTQNRNISGAQTYFTTGEGPGLVNAPVVPDAIYVGRVGAQPGVSIIDLNGFGQSTGDPTFDPSYQTFEEGRSNFPNNPNVRLQGGLLRPSLTPGTCTVNGGSSGVFTLTRDSSLNDLLLRAPLISNIGDMMLGHGLDSAFNNGPQPFGCQAGGGNLCAQDGKKIISPVTVGAGNTMGPTQQGQFGGLAAGAENLVGWAPHPNPPPLVFPPICVSPFIGSQEPTSIDTQTVALLTNLLAPGDPFGQPLLGIPPSGLLTPEQNAFFEGPSLEQATIGACANFQVRQQIGQYLYVIDRARREIVVLNSNRMTVIDRILTFDPTSLAMSPNLNFLAVVNQLSNLVSFIDIDPNSATFHQVVQETVVGQRPRGIAWDPGNEDILVANEGENTVSIVSASSLTVRKVVRSQLNLPFEIAITQRQPCWGFSRNVYFAYILNRNGKLAVFESGPNLVNGWGYDDVIGVSTETFLSPKAIQADPIDLRSAVWIAHEGPINLTNGQPGVVGIPALSKFVAISGNVGQLPLNSQSLLIPQFRDIAYAVQISLGSDKLSGLPVDLAFDDLRSLSGLPNFTTPFSVGTPAQSNGKSQIRNPCPGVSNALESKYVFVAVPNPTGGTGVVDVILLDGTFGRQDVNPFIAGTQSIPAPNVQVLTSYFRQ
jgi:hypothetical protein